MLKNEFQRKHWPSCTIRENSRHAATTWAGRDAVPAPWHLCTLPTVMLSPARFPWEGASRLHTEQGATNSMVCRPSSLTCAWAWPSRDSVPPVPLEHSSPNLGGLKPYKAFRNHAFGLQNTGYSFLQQICCSMKQGWLLSSTNTWPPISASCKGQVPSMNLLNFTAIRSELSSAPWFPPFLSCLCIFAPCVSKKSDQPQVHLHGHYEAP